MVKKKTTRKRRTTKKSLETEGLLVVPNFSRYFLLLAIILSLLALLWVISPFFTVLIYAALIAIFFNPVHKWFVKIFRGHKGIAAFCSTFLVMLLVLGPLTLFTIFIAQEAVVTYQVLEEKLLEMDLQSIDFTQVETLPVVGEYLDNFMTKYHLYAVLDGADVDLFSVVQEISQTVTTFIVNSTGALLKSVGTTVVNIFILILTVFFFFRDGEKIRAYLRLLSPLPKEHEDVIETKLRETTRGMVIGAFGTAILQGVMGGIGFAIAGLEHAVFYATIMSFAALIPYIGSSVIWGPAALALLLQGNMVWGIFLLAWGFVVITNIDNIARPYLIGSAASMHPLATFLAVLGGLFVFGIEGIVFGPIILSLVLTILHIYQLEYKTVLAK